MKAAVMQPTYLPWAGYMAMLDQADIFVLLDSVSFSRQSWQQRNRIRLPDGTVTWLTVPVTAHLGTRLDEVQIADTRWQAKHWRTLTQAYSRAPHWPQLSAALKPMYVWPWTRLALMNTELIRTLASYLKITTPIFCASELGPTRSDRVERLQDLLTLVGADTLLEPASGTYLQDAPFHVEWFSYPAAEAPLSVVDTIARCGIAHTRELLRGAQ